MTSIPNRKGSVLQHDRRDFAWFIVVALLVSSANSFPLNTIAARRKNPTYVVSPEHQSLSNRGLRLQQGLSEVDVLQQTANTAQMFDGVLSAISPSEHPVASILGSYALVTAADMVPFLPCQPLAVALGAKLGFSLAFPITAAGQTTAGILAFTFARRAADTDMIRDAAAARLEPEALEEFEEFRIMTAGGTKEDDRNVLLTLIGLRLAPFFPFSAGNYLLGSATAVPLSLFTGATLFGCLLSNFVSTSIGAGGAIILHL